MLVCEFKRFCENVLPNDTVFMFLLEPGRGNVPYDEEVLRYGGLDVLDGGIVLRDTPSGCGTVADMVDILDGPDGEELAVVLGGYRMHPADSCYFGYAEDIGRHYVLFSEEEADPDLAGGGEVLYVNG